MEQHRRHLRRSRMRTALLAALAVLIGAALLGLAFVVTLRYLTLD
jgi:hypothetical protein